MDDIFDIVDEQDRVIGQRPRSQVHREGLIHRAVHVMVFNSSGEIFLQKRSMSKDKHPGVWDSSASGHVDSGEDYDTSAIRETREEIGLVLPQAPERLFKVGACPQTGEEFVWVYRCQAEGPFTLNPQELDSGGWFAPGEVTRWMRSAPGEFAPALIYIWPLLCSRLGLA